MLGAMELWATPNLARSCQQHVLTAVSITLSCDVFLRRAALMYRLRTLHVGRQLLASHARAQ